MRCPACGGENPENKRFCKYCGGTLGVLCTSCGAQLEPDNQFCGDCGTPISGGAAPVPSRVLQSEAPQPVVGYSPVSERRLCSVLFVDLVGFTPLAEKRDPEEIRELLSLYFERAQAIVGHYGGTVEKFIGDAVMAVWGAPVANEDDAERAVRAALDDRGLGDRARSRVRRASSPPGRASSRARSPSRSARCPRAWCSATR